MSNAIWFTDERGNLLDLSKFIMFQAGNSEDDTIGYISAGHGGDRVLIRAPLHVIREAIKGSVPYIWRIGEEEEGEDE